MAIRQHRRIRREKSSKAIAGSRASWERTAHYSPQKTVAKLISVSNRLSEVIDSVLSTFKAIRENPAARNRKNLAR
jgi:hypothetical protein